MHTVPGRQHPALETLNPHLERRKIAPELHRLLCQLRRRDKMLHARREEGHSSRRTVLGHLSAAVVRVAVMDNM